MRLTRRVAIGIALACGVLAAALTIIYLKGPGTRQRSPEETQQVQVVVPQVPIPTHSLITGDMLTTAKVDASQAPSRAVKSPDEIVGYVAVMALDPKVPISTTQIARPGTLFGFAGEVPQGMRAVTVAVDPVIGVAGLLKAGNRVDIVATFEVEDDLLARTILQDIQLLALDSQTTATTARTEKQAAASQAERDASPDSQPDRTRAVEYTNATLAVTPEDAQRLILADKQGQLRLILRPIGERDFVPVSVQDMTSVAGPEYAVLRAKAERKKRPPESEKAAPTSQVQAATWTQPPWPTQPAAPKPKKEPKKPQVEIIRGDQHVTVTP